MKKITALFAFVCSIASLVLAQPATEIVIQANKPGAPIQSTMWGIFFEDINFAGDGGVYAELVKNGSFEFDERLMGWQQPNTSPYFPNTNSGIGLAIKDNQNSKSHYLQVDIKNSNRYEIINEGFRGIGAKAGDQYNFSIKAKSRSGAITRIKIQLIDVNGKSLGEGSIALTGTAWQLYKTIITASQTEAHAKLKLTFTGNGIVDVDHVSLFPKNTWKGRPQGLRQDLVQLLADLKPGFIRFPGGCIVEGRTLEQRYQWKKTVGDIDQRELLINRWNNEIKHRPAPDYFQSFGLGFFEYFQMAEDIGAEPLPILGCGMACQFNTSELAPLNDLDIYIQDALDLIEFANGPAESIWGRVRAGMGHPQPFNLKYIGIGNEQWGEEYFSRLTLFMDVIRKKYPQIKIITSAGPFAEGEFFNLANQELKKLNAELVDEHYYKDPNWFLQNASRYDSYDKNSFKIFAGEYAAQSVAVVSPDNKNNWQCALAEAAYMTGLERNAEVVHMTSYAPLFAHTEAWQWTPNLIWFDNLNAYGTPSYYVQKLFANYRGTKVLPALATGKPLTGEKGLYASAVLDESTNEIIIKVVNAKPVEQSVNFTLDGIKRLTENNQLIQLASSDLGAENSLIEAKKLIPVESIIKVKGKSVMLKLPGSSVSLLRLKRG
jgi:alpha-L-arabinofuranosidase